MQIKKVGLILLALGMTGAIVGCGAGGPQAVEKASDQEVAKVAELRKIFDSVHGDYSQLSDAQKKTFLDYAKGDQHAVDQQWAFMKNPKGGAPAQAAPSPSEEMRQKQMQHGGGQ